ncbi:MULTISPECIES: hypothetical protein [unclassified Moorena]|uniref:hypothetical protein n=1 Tax=unclassified Moorena TaxID=2683338 RepID=UPI0025F1A7A9|nr:MULTISPECIES: hypothetical protein [unclassified Moorena]
MAIAIFPASLNNSCSIKNHNCVLNKIARYMFSRNLAFIIGINNYQNGISPLNTAVNDAKKLGVADYGYGFAPLAPQFW